MSAAEEHLVGLLSHSALLRFRTNSARLVQFLQTDPFVRHHLPNVQYISDVVQWEDSAHWQQSPVYEIHFVETTAGPIAEFDWTHRCLYVTGLLGRDFEELTLVFNAVQFFARMYQELGLFSIHCGGVVCGTNAVLILGGAAAGKSVVTARLCSEFNASYLNDERALVSRQNDGTIAWVGGNTVLTLRPDVLNYFGLDHLGIKFRNVTHDSIATHKFSFESRVTQIGALPIRHIVFVRLTNGISQFRRHHLDSALYDLFAILSEDIHGLYGPFLRAGYAMPSLDDEVIRSQRLAIATTLGNSPINIWQCEGTSQEVCEMILRGCSG
ncbi:hypothetical protein BROC_02522 [Candidatus Brocadiaceae bacterium]|nr:hypothetical protein BROC_02522 [Candidatus Brocadiaceae bacterium]